MYNTASGKVQKVLSAIMAVIIIITMLPANKAAAAQTAACDYDSYSVTYKTLAEWEGHKNIEITIVNTGKEQPLQKAMR